MQGGQGIMNKYRLSTSSEEGDSGQENDGDWELEGVRKTNRKAVKKSTGQQHSGGFLDTIASFFPFVCGGGTATSPQEKRRKSRMRH